MKTQQHDPYQILGVPHTADSAAIKAAYRKLARQYHPDVNPGNPHAEERFKAINRAYQTLTDPQKPKETRSHNHDQTREEGYTHYHTHNRRGSTHFNPESLAILKSAFALSDKFNNYADCLDRTPALYKMAQAEAFRNAPLRTLFNRLSQFPDHKAAEIIIENLLKQEKVLELRDDIESILSNINKLHKDQYLPDLTPLKPRIARLDQLLDRRFDILASTLEFVAGRADTLKYRPKSPH